MTSKRAGVVGAIASIRSSRSISHRVEHVAGHLEADQVAHARA